jgi:hypothetical protein
MVLLLAGIAQTVECGSVTLLSLVLSIRVMLEILVDLYKLLPDTNTLVVN